MSVSGPGKTGPVADTGRNRGIIEPGPRTTALCLLPIKPPAPPPRQLARQPALSAALHHRAVLGRQRHRRPPRRRAYSAGDADVPALVAGVSDHSPVYLEPPQARLGRDPRQARNDGRALRHRHRRLQHPAILVARTYPGAEHAAAAVGRAAGRRDLVADPARRAVDPGAGRRRRAVAGRRAGDPAARRPHCAQKHRVQQGRHHLHRGAGRSSGSTRCCP